MSRLKPISIPTGVNVTVNDGRVVVKGPKGELQKVLNEAVNLECKDNVLSFSPRAGVENATALSGTARSLLNNMVQGVSHGFEKKLQLIGVGYRAQAQGKTLSLTLGFSHPVNFPVPNGITIETPSATEILIKGIDKQLVGQVAANIRAYRSPEPYKGKGVRYAKEVVIMKEAKKK